MKRKETVKKNRFCGRRKLWTPKKNPSNKNICRKEYSLSQCCLEWNELRVKMEIKEARGEKVF